MRKEVCWARLRDVAANTASLVANLISLASSKHFEGGNRESLALALLAFSAIPICRGFLQLLLRFLPQAVELSREDLDDLLCNVVLSKGGTVLATILFFCFETFSCIIRVPMR